MPNDEEWLDDDILAMNLDYAEKSGLQIYRNYTNAFEDHAIKRFRKTLDQEALDLSKFTRLTELLVSEDIRFTPVIVCGYADVALKATFERALPADTPGGTRDMLSGYGPLSDLSKRIRMAFAFDVLSRDLMADLDRVRKVRNRLSHDWDLKAASELVEHPTLAEMYPIETALLESGLLSDDQNAEGAFRARLIWLTGRLTYEEAAFHRAKAARISPHRALYDNGGTSWLKAVSAICGSATRRLGKQKR